MMRLIEKCDKIVEVFDVYETQKHLYIVMEACEGDLEHSLGKTDGNGFP